MELALERVELLLLIAAIVSIVARRVRIPYTIALFLAGLAFAVLPGLREVNLSKELIFSVFLPPLVYEAAIYIHWRELGRELPVIITYATLGVLISAAVTAAGMHYLAGWPWPSAILFGSMIAATDPVSVIATFKEANVKGRLRLLVEAESLFNDGTAAVAFVIALAFATGSQITVGETLFTLTSMVFGGLLCGALVAGGVLILAWRTNDPMVEIALTTIAAYSSFFLAEHFHFSGVLATLTAGLITGNIGPLGVFSVKGRVAVESYWEYIAFVVNSLIFILIGIREADQNFLGLIVPFLIAIGVVLVGRALAIYPVSMLFSKTSLQIKASHQHILFWGGLRGALALALALGLPPEIPKREEIITIAFGVVGFSVIVQGLTITPLLRKLKEIPGSSHKKLHDA